MPCMTTFAENGKPYSNLLTQARSMSPSDKICMPLPVALLLNVPPPPPVGPASKWLCVGTKRHLSQELEHLVQI